MALQTFHAPDHAHVLLRTSFKLLEGYIRNVLIRNLPVLKGVSNFCNPVHHICQQVCSNCAAFEHVACRPLLCHLMFYSLARSFGSFVPSPPSLPILLEHRVRNSAVGAARAPS